MEVENRSKVRKGSYNILVLRTKEILCKPGRGWYNYTILGDLLGDGIFTRDGEKWRHQRRVSSYEFSTKVLRTLADSVRNDQTCIGSFPVLTTLKNSMDIQNIIVMVASPFATYKQSCTTMHAPHS
ncbi:hypothetical protein Scep_006672 [Stephania cephalantha]|uniref:Cytochrome P450 n=1 Tax=Stephania cephalantha TaxID=152367 RepID=A0AAP0KB53_9MAGN